MLTTRTILALCFAAALALLSTTSRAASGPVGVNLEQFRSYAPEWGMVDAFVKTRPWIAGGREPGKYAVIWNVCNQPNPVYNNKACESSPPMSKDNDGWVTSMAQGIVPHTQVFEELGGDYPAGRYVLLYEGRGRVRVDGDPDRRASGGCSETDISDGRGCFQVSKPGAGGIHVWIEESDPVDPVRNVRLIVPGGVQGTVAGNGEIESIDSTSLCKPNKERGKKARKLKPGAQCIDLEHAHWNRFSDPVEWIGTRRVLFHPVTLNYLRQFSVLRFLQWQRTNGSPVTGWADRTTLSASNWTMTPAGVPPEIMIALANATEATPWFNIPHLADTGWSEQFAALVDEQLAGERSVIVEWSNEVWNGAFSQTRWSTEEAKRRGIPGKYDMQKMNRVVAEQTATHGAVWRKRLGERARVVVAGQGSNAHETEERLRWKDTHKLVDAVAIAPYFGHRIGDSKNAIGLLNGGGLDALFKQLEPELAGAVTDMQKTAAAAKRHGVAMIAYESGQHLAARGDAQRNDAVTDLFKAANADPRMGALYAKYFDAWRENGGELIVHHTQLGKWTRWGSWGLKQRQSDTRADSPKLDALLKFVETTPCWWENCAERPVRAR